jgi:hypothetical protein
MSCVAHSPPRETASRLLTITEEVQARLSLICADMPTPAFKAMVTRIAWVQLTFESDPFVSSHVHEATMPRRTAH